MIENEILNFVNPSQHSVLELHEASGRVFDQQITIAKGPAFGNFTQVLASLGSNWTDCVPDSFVQEGVKGAVKPVVWGCRNCFEVKRLFNAFEHLPPGTGLLKVKEDSGSSSVYILDAASKILWRRIWDLFPDGGSCRDMDAIIQELWEHLWEIGHFKQ